jgi:hypothetical protein
VAANKPSSFFDVSSIHRESLRFEQLHFTRRALRVRHCGSFALRGAKLPHFRAAVCVAVYGNLSRLTRSNRRIETLNDIFRRLDNFGDQIQQRIESAEYLSLVRKTFRSWDEADTQEKKQMLKRLIMNAGAIQLCDDDLIRLFLHWVELYHETHFVVVREIYRSRRITRGQLWSAIRGKPRPREDSYEADLFKYLIRDLSTGGVIRQERQTDGYGNFVKKESPGRRQPSGHVMKSAFDDAEYYVLTDLGAKFVHYVMEDVAPQLGANTIAEPQP